MEGMGLEWNGQHCRSWWWVDFPSWGNSNFYFILEEEALYLKYWTSNYFLYTHGTIAKLVAFSILSLPYHFLYFTSFYFSFLHKKYLCIFHLCIFLLKKRKVKTIFMCFFAYKLNLCFLLLLLLLLNLGLYTMQCSWLWGWFLDHTYRVWFSLVLDRTSPLEG